MNLPLQTRLSDPKNGEILKVEIIGFQGDFGSAIYQVLTEESKDKNFQVIGTDRPTAMESPERNTPEILFLAIPSWAKEDTLNYIRKNPHSIIVLTSKGVETQDLYQQLTQEEKDRVLIFSGPNKAVQIKTGSPTASVIAGQNKAVAEIVHSHLNTPRLRLYASESPNVVQWSGILKNLIVLELGRFWDQVGLEIKIKLLSQALDAVFAVIKAKCPPRENPHEFWGIAGLGDILLCLEFFPGESGSRNFKFGKRIASGENPDTVEADFKTVEGRKISESFWHNTVDFCEVSEMKTFQKTLQDLKDGNMVNQELPLTDPQVKLVFAGIFSYFLKICKTKNYQGNTQAWFFSRFYKELVEFFPETNPQTILNTLLATVLEETPNKTLEFRDWVNRNDHEIHQQFPILFNTKRLIKGDLNPEQAEREILGRETLQEGL